MLAGFVYGGVGPTYNLGFVSRQSGYVIATFGKAILFSNRAGGVCVIYSLGNGFVNVAIVCDPGLECYYRSVVICLLCAMIGLLDSLLTIPSQSP